MPFRSTTIRNKVRAALAADQPPCHVCGGEIAYDAHYLDPLSFTVDHVLPSARGGTDTLDNALAAHRKCNREKGDKLNIAVRFETERAW